LQSRKVKRTWALRWSTSLVVNTSGIIVSGSGGGRGRSKSLIFAHLPVELLSLLWKRTPSSDPEVKNNERTRKRTRIGVPLSLSEQTFIVVVAAVSAFDLVSE